VLYIGSSHTPGNRIRVHKYDKPHNAHRIMGPYERTTAFKNEARLIKLFQPKYNGDISKAGRKKIEPSNKMTLVGFYTKRKVVENAGGMDAARQEAKEYFETKYL
jgi:hypothetical protein